MISGRHISHKLGVYNSMFISSINYKIIKHENNLRLVSLLPTPRLVLFQFLRLSLQFLVYIL